MADEENEVIDSEDVIGQAIEDANTAIVDGEDIDLTDGDEDEISEITQEHAAEQEAPEGDAIVESDDDVGKPGEAEAAPVKDEAPAEKSPDDEHSEFSKTITRKETKERFDTVLNESKNRLAKITELEAQVTQANESMASWRADLLGGGLQVEQVSEGIGILESYTNMDAKGLLANHDSIAKFVSTYETLTGKSLSSGAAAFEDFDDLKSDVEEMDITPERANEIANVRKREQLQNNRVQQQQAAQQAAQPSQQEIQLRGQAQNIVAQKIKSLTATDVDWAVKQDRVTSEFVRRAQEGIQSGKIGWAYTPELFDIVVNEVTRQIKAEQRSKTPSAHVNSMRPGAKTPKGAKQEIDMNSDDFISQILEGAT